MQRFSDFSGEVKPLDGEKISIDKLIDKEIEVHNYNIRNSKFNRPGSNQCMTVQIMCDNQKRIFFTGSDVLINQCEKYSDNMPFITAIKKINRYYTFS